MKKLDRKVIAYHEAGHAMVDFFFDHEVERISILRDGDAAGGVLVNRAHHDALRNEDDLEKQVPFERAIMAAMAGEIAQRKFAPGSVDDVHAATDRHVVNEYLDELDTPTQEVREAYLRVLQLRTAALLERHWQHVERLAKALLERGTLTEAEAREAMADPRWRNLPGEGAAS